MRLHIVGAGGHARVALEAWLSMGGTIAAFYDDRAGLRGLDLLGVNVAGPVADALAAAGPLHIALGDNEARARIASGVDDERCPAVIHAAAVVSPSAVVGAGALVCAGAVVQAGARIGRHVVVNSQALVEHDVALADFVHVAPGVRLGGAVAVGAGALVGIGAVVLPNVRIGIGAVVGAGAIVIRDVPDGALVVGNPARRRERG